MHSAPRLSTAFLLALFLAMIAAPALAADPGLTGDTIKIYAQVEFALSHDAKKVAIISQRDAWGRARYNPLLEAFKKKGVTPVADEEMTADTNDATPQVLRLRQAGADGVIVLLYPKPA